MKKGDRKIEDKKMEETIFLSSIFLSPFFPAFSVAAPAPDPLFSRGL
jgi:hypothetical protein